MNLKKTASVNRRMFLKGSAALAGVSAAGLTPFSALTASAATGKPPRPARIGQGGYGRLFPVRDARDGVIRMALPAGFSYMGLGFEGDPMSDGNLTPRAHDGMGAFRLPNGNIRLVRNHEERDGPDLRMAFGDPGKAYDPRAGGGNTSLEIMVLRDGSIRLVRDFISLNGTYVNCAGGPTPWGSWLSCEETTAGILSGFGRPHGYVFEIPARAQNEVTPVPLTDMGRFSHEAAAVDPATGFLYETEDNGDSGFFRFLPNQPRNLTAGGTLQMLAVRDLPNFDTRTGQRIDRALPAVWVDIDNPDPPEADTNSKAVYDQGFIKGGAVFRRLEGCWYGNGSIFFSSTSGGDAGEGQVWEYQPNGQHGFLKLIFESPDESVLDNPDNITVSPRGGVLLCEDGDRDGLFMRGLTRTGRIFNFARNLINEREWAGACFSPDGQTLFVNIQGDTRSGGPGNLGMTFAIRGPWQDGAL